MEAANASELFVPIYQLARCHIPQYGNLHQHCCENLVYPKNEMLCITVLY